MACVKISKICFELTWSAHKNFRAFGKSLDEPPSVKYVNNVHGEPENPIIGVSLVFSLLSSLTRVSFIALLTGFRFSR